MTAAGISYGDALAYRRTEQQDDIASRIETGADEAAANGGTNHDGPGH
jgi:hypothetical protein